MRIAISGPAASGKGSISKMLARRYKLLYVDCGLIFRCAAFLHREKVVRDIGELGRMRRSGLLKYVWDGSAAYFRLGSITLNAELASPSIASLTATLAAQPADFWKLVALADGLIEPGVNLVADGRNAGTLLLSDADAKFYLTAELRVRAKRRRADMLSLGYTQTYREVLRNLRERDTQDMNRKNAPLAVPEDAEVIHTDYFSCEEILDKIHYILESKGLTMT